MDQRNLPQFQAVNNRLAQRECIERTVDISTGEVTIEEKERSQQLQFIGELEKMDTTNERFLKQTDGR